jgi:hypothetical protein
MGAAGREFALSTYSADRLLADIRNLYYKLAAEAELIDVARESAAAQTL